MPINYNKLYEEQLREMSDILELINYRPRTIESYLRSISECCEWLGSTFGISIGDATVSQLRAFLAFLHRPASEGGRELKPRFFVFNRQNSETVLLTKTVSKLSTPLSSSKKPCHRMDKK